MFEGVSQDVVFGTVNPSRPVTNYGVNQIWAFAQTGSSVVLQSFKGKPEIFLAEGHTDIVVWQIVQQKVKEYKNDTAKLHNQPVNAQCSRV
jgi:hypothetical protein